MCLLQKSVVKAAILQFRQSATVKMAGLFPPLKVLLQKVKPA
jgi:hypothetical protein